MLWPGRILRAGKPKVLLHNKPGPDSQKRIVGRWDFERLGCRWDWRNPLYTLSFLVFLISAFLFLFFGWGPSYFLGRGIELCVLLFLLCSCFCKSNRTAYCSGLALVKAKWSKRKDGKYDETTTPESLSRNFKNRESGKERETKIVKRPCRLFYLSTFSVRETRWGFSSLFFLFSKSAKF